MALQLAAEALGVDFGLERRGEQLEAAAGFERLQELLLDRILANLESQRNHVQLQHLFECVKRGDSLVLLCRLFVEDSAHKLILQRRNESRVLDLPVATSLQRTPL